MAFTCPACGATSYHPEDERHGWCGRCHTATGDVREQLEQLPLLNALELRVLYGLLDIACKEHEAALRAAQADATRGGLSERYAVLNGLRTAVGEARAGLRRRMLTGLILEREPDPLT